MKLHIIATVYNRVDPIQRLIYDFRCQTNPNWTLHVIQDGPEFKDTQKFVKSLKDPRVTFITTRKVNGHFGFPNRDMMIKKIKGEPGDFVLHTNDDNQYVPVFVDMFLRNCNEKTGFIFCNTLHSYFHYEILYTRIKVCYIDMGSFIVRLDVARAIGFSQVSEVADGIYAEECAAECRKRGLDIKVINKALFIHN